MSKTNKRRVFAEPQVFSAQEFEASGIRELSFEELLEVNGGKQVKDDPRTDKNSDTCPHSSNTPRESSSSGNGSSGGSSGGGASSGSSVSSGNLSSSGSSGSYSSESSGASNASGGSSTSGGSNKEEERSPTQGGGAPHAEISSPSGGGGSFDRDSPERDRDSDRDSGSWSGNYTPSGQSRESPKPNKGEEKSPTQGGGAPRGEAAATGRNHGKNTGAINSETTGGVLSGFKEFWGNAGNTVKNTAGKIRDKDGIGNQYRTIKTSGDGSTNIVKDNTNITGNQSNSLVSRNLGSQLVGGNIVYNENNKRFSDIKTGRIKNNTEIVINRTHGHTKGHYLSQLNVNVQSSDGSNVTLFSNSVQSWADKDKSLGDNDFTMLAGHYKGFLLPFSASGLYKEPILLVNEKLGVKGIFGFFIHANEQTTGNKWENTGGSLGCQILSGHMLRYNRFTGTLKEAGFKFNGNDVIDVQVRDPAGYYTTQNSQEFSLNMRGNIPW